MGTVDKFRAVFGDMAIRSVHHNVARLDAARAILKIEGLASERRGLRGMLDNGYTREFANRTFRQLEGFGSYGFPESHAASFALIAYASSFKLDEMPPSRRLPRRDP